MEKQPIPTRPFDPQRHVIQVRETGEGREEFVTLQSLVEAERPFEAQYEAVELDEIKRQIDALKNQPNLSDGLLDHVSRLMKETAAPPQLAQETTAVLTDLTEAVLKLQARQSEQERRIEIIEKSIVAVGEKLGI